MWGQVLPSIPNLPGFVKCAAQTRHGLLLRQKLTIKAVGSKDKAEEYRSVAVSDTGGTKPKTTISNRQVKVLMIKEIPTYLFSLVYLEFTNSLISNILLTALVALPLDKYVFKLQIVQVLNERKILLQTYLVFNRVYILQCSL